MKSIFTQVADLEVNEGTAILCTIVDAKGSAPRRSSSKMLVFPDGTFSGTVGGGEVEGRIIKEALQSLSDGKTRLLHYDLVNPESGDPGICGGQVEVYVEPIYPNPKLVVIGGGHVGSALIHIGKWLGFRVVVSDEREEFCNPDVHPDGDEFFNCPMEELPAKVNIHSSTYIVLATGGVDIDVPGLPGLIKSDAAYVGVLGSKKRWASTRKGLIEMGIGEDKINKVNSPVGLELNAETPEEIAVSILAEILMLRHEGSGQSMKV
jgi:xanthine dehydrogenase accessory factor